MTKRVITVETLRAMASASGLDLTDDQLDDLLPQVQRAVDELERLDILELQDVEPAVQFRADLED